MLLQNFAARLSFPGNVKHGQKCPCLRGANEVPVVLWQGKDGEPGLDVSNVCDQGTLWGR